MWTNEALDANVAVQMKKLEIPLFGGRYKGTKELTGGIE
jgi:hypothetical protein